MIFTSWNFKQRVASWTFKQRVASYFRENNKLQVDLKFFLKMNNCPNIIWLPKGRCIQFQVNQVSLGQDIQQNPILFVFQWLKIKGFLKWLLMNTLFPFLKNDFVILLYILTYHILTAFGQNASFKGGFYSIDQWDPT